MTNNPMERSSNGAQASKSGASGVSTSPENGTQAATAAPVLTPDNEEYERVIIRGEAQAVQLSNIEKEITKIWQTAAKAQEGEHANEAVMRACVLNLVIYVNGEEGLEKATDVVARLTWCYPCRAIVLVARPNQTEDNLSAFISAHCQLPDPKGKRACCEQITVEGSSKTPERLASVVLPLLVPDLPVVMWWPGDPTLDGPVFDRIMHTSDRLIVDSRSFEDPVRSFTRLAELSELSYQGVAFSDLNWARLTPWRRLIAQFFDAPSNLPFLNHFDRIVIDYEAPDGQSEPNFSQGLLLVGWLGQQLGWKEAFALQKRDKNATLIVNEAGRPLTIEFKGHNERRDEAGGLTGISLHTAIPEEGRSATFAITLTTDFKHADVTIQETDKPDRSRTVVLERRDEADLLGEDLAVIKHDQVYEMSLALAGKLSAQPVIQ